MFSPEINSNQIILKQYKYKLHAYLGVFTSLAFVQIVAMAFSLAPFGSSGGGSESFRYSMEDYSGNLLAIFTFLWAFINSFTITTKGYRQDDFLFVTNRKTQGISNVLFLLTACVIAVMTSVFATQVLKILVYYVKGVQNLFIVPLTTSELFLGSITFYAYTLLFASAGYLIGTLYQWNKAIAIAIPVLYLGSSIALGIMTGNVQYVEVLFQFYGKEPSPFLFLVKTTSTTAALFLAAFAVSRRLEVLKS